MSIRYHKNVLINSVGALFLEAGLDEPIAKAVAEILVEADLLGYSTHGLQFVPAYLSGIEGGDTKLSGIPRIIHDQESALVLDAQKLPGQWSVLHALKIGLERIKKIPLVTISIRRSGNISCLATYVRRAADQGLIGILMASGPGNAGVAPHRAKAPLLSTNPIAFAVPAQNGMILADTSTASSSMRAIERAKRENTKLPEGRIINYSGKASTDPDDILSSPAGAILPMGGLDLGHKGFAFSILVEALTSGLSGAGRSSSDQYGNNVFLMLLEPDGFSGASSLKSEMEHLATRCREMPAIDPDNPVRIPGDRALALFEEQSREGIVLHPEIIGLLEPCFRRYRLTPPVPISR
ncbi:MAG: Ldh family oxidoreductase [SAR324 cluster bacterium]|nr:Ldh family oxidoreductase [SAR324 cluster bacterium]